MRFTYLAVLVPMLMSPLAGGQAGQFDPNYIPRVNVAVGYNLVRGNAPPAVSNTFGMNGGFASVGVTIRPWLTAAGEVTGEHGINIGPLGQDLTLMTYTAGPRITLHYSRFVPFAQATFGIAHASDSYFPRGTTYSASATSFAYSLGGGLDWKLSSRFDIRPVQLQYLRTGLPNGSSDWQNHLVYGAGVVVKLGAHLWTPDPGRARHKAYKAMRDADKAVEVPVAASRAEAPEPPAAPVASPAPPVETASAAPAARAPAEFHAYVPDVYFDYDSATLRPDDRGALQTAAAWLQSHPDVRVEIGGYADERGTEEYNRLLGLKRAEVTREALVEAGVNGSRLTTHSYGKLIQSCDSKQESCFRMNRRAAFNIQPRTSTCFRAVLCSMSSSHQL